MEYISSYESKNDRTERIIRKQTTSVSTKCVRNVWTGKEQSIKLLQIWTIGVRFQAGTWSSLYVTISRPALVPKYTYMQWKAGNFLRGIMQKEHEADHSPLIPSTYS
jgi:hypothetical protein